MRQKIEDEQNNGKNFPPGTTFTSRRLQRVGWEQQPVGAGVVKDKLAE